MIVGFTGTRYGMTPSQKVCVHDLLILLGVTVLLHGDCIGADAEAHEIALALGIAVDIHPPVDEKHRAFCKGARFIAEPKTHFARNRDIVNLSECLIGAPYENERQDRGGTWYTIDYANKIQRVVHRVWPGELP